MTVSRDVIVAAVSVAATCLPAQVWIWSMARSGRVMLAAVDERRERSERDRDRASRSAKALAAELNSVHQRAVAVLAAVREHPDAQAVRTACLAAVEPIVVLRQATSASKPSSRPAGISPPVPPARWVDGSMAVVLAILSPGITAYAMLHEIVVAAAASAVSGLAALVAFRRAYTTRRDIEDELIYRREIEVAARDAGTTRDLQRAYSEYLNSEVGRFFLAVGNGHLSLDDGTRDAARLLGLRLEAALPPTPSAPRNARENPSARRSGVRT